MIYPLAWMENAYQAHIHMKSSRLGIGLQTMDLIADLLQGVRAREAVLHRSILAPPWSLRIAEEAHLTVVTVLGGQLYADFDDGESFCLNPGEIAIIRAGEHYTVADPPATPVQVVITPDGAVLPDGSPLPPQPDTITCTLAEAGGTVVVSGNYMVSGDLSQRLVAPLPRWASVVLPHRSALLDVLIEEIEHSGPGQQAALDRWLDLALVTTLRRWFDREPTAPRWYAALGDPVVGIALRVIHERPGDPWTVGSLAKLTACSRTKFAARFSDLVGEPPMSYLTGLRLDTAADLLRHGDLTISAVASRVGYASPFALSAALKRRRGIRPSELRNAQPAELPA